MEAFKMGTVIDYYECECGGLRYNEWNYRTGEESDYCMKCGKHQEAFRYKDENGDYVLEEAVTKDGEPYQRLALKVRKGGGYGSAAISVKDHVAQQMFWFDSKESAFKFKEDILKSQDQYDLKASYIYLYDPETKTGEVIFGQGRPQEAWEDCEPEANPTSSDIDKEYCVDDAELRF